MAKRVFFLEQLRKEKNNVPVVNLTLSVPALFRQTENIVLPISMDSFLSHGL